jgi:hypothetical protein
MRTEHFLSSSSLGAAAFARNRGRSNVFDAIHQQLPYGRQSECGIEWCFVSWL